MNYRDYEYAVEQCDVASTPKARRRLQAYREFRTSCLERLNGNENISVSRQIHELIWHTMVFYCLNEARRIESSRIVNGPLFELLGAGFSNIMTLGIRRLVDTDGQTMSLVTLIQSIEKQADLLTREHFVSYDGIPFDGSAAEAEYVEQILREGAGMARWLPTKGPKAWSTSQMMHAAFDRTSGKSGSRTRGDAIGAHVLVNLKDALSSPEITRVKTFADRVVAHADRLAAANQVEIPSFDDVQAALKTLTQVAHFLSSQLFYDGFGTVVPVPQFDVFSSLDKGWVQSETVPALHDYWQTQQRAMDDWVSEDLSHFLKVPS